MKLNFNEGWEHEGKGEFKMTDCSAEITKTEVRLGRWKYMTDVQAGKTFKFSVRCKPEGCANAEYPYAMVSFYKEDKSAIIKMYADNINAEGTEKECTFTTPEDCKYIGIELALRGTGKVTWSVPEINECEPETKRTVKIAATRIKKYLTREEVDAAILGVVDRAGRMGADIIIMSEGMYALAKEPFENKPQTTDGPYCTMMKKKAKEYGAYIVANFHEADGGNYYNTSVLIDREGNIAGKYRKTHISYGEWENGIIPGDDFPVFETDFGRVGMLICWDMYFPESARIMAMNGAELIAVSTMGDPAFRHVSRAMENGVYVAVSGAQYHNLNDCRVEPSKIIAPDGEILDQTDEIGGVAFAEVDLKDKKQMYWLSIPASFSVPANVYKNERRHELYKDI